MTGKSLARIQTFKRITRINISAFNAFGCVYVSCFLVFLCCLDAALVGE